ncbi:MAG: ABC transporter permease [Candidatus Eremiobacteraeota bacterium]|nr:ABC transporter permease [Candidatus Eremiobacteraeota bacterium]MBV8365779.1 ABC transporter permease [Candidatus Eremiobacteraeota bacterium]
MTSFIAARTLRFIAVLLTICVLSFLFLHLIPGNPIQIMLGEHATRSDIQRLTHELRLDRPWYEQLGAYLWQVAHGNLGRSLADNEPVSAKLAQHFPATIELTVAAMIFAVLVGIPAGIFAALTHRSALDTLISIAVLLGVSVPVFWLGWMMLYAFAYEPSRAGMDLFPIGGRLSLRYAVEPRTQFVILDTMLAGDWAALGDALRHLVLPAITLGTIPLAIIAKMTRASMLDVLSMDYVRTARAKGLGMWAVTVRHSLRNAFIPILTVIGLQTGLLLGGAVLTEHIFAWPGVGRLAFEAISNRDSPLVNGSILLFAATFVLVNLAIDVAYAMLDPRIRYT